MPSFYTFQSLCRLTPSCKLRGFYVKLIRQPLPLQLSPDKHNFISIRHIGTRSSNASTHHKLAQNANLEDHFASPTSNANSWMSAGRPRLSRFGARPTIIALASIAFSAITILSFKKYMINQEARHILHPDKFTPFEIIRREVVSSTAILLTVCTLHDSPEIEHPDPYAQWWQRGIWSVEVKQPQLQIARSYTPLPPSSGEPQHHLRFLIRRQPKGEMSNYLYKLHVGAKIYLRGPKVEFELPEVVGQVLFLAAGTGIAPALQIIHTLLERQSNDKPCPFVHISWANRLREDCKGGNEVGIKSNGSRNHDRDINLIVQELEALRQKYPNYLTLDYLVDEERTRFTPRKLSQLVKINPCTENRPGARLLFVSGPEGFSEAMAGPKKWEDGDEKQGELGGILKRLSLDDWKIWKL
ncbi:BgTH12-01939 [Blumeria graminis f. sp. triticale]|uniref:BgTH12-01939 n=1 Tax=Blumeria graminis f. sp. triticale TaxID=1689686 RepID=A0A9W4DH68_BLUGR|nr:BgTH12-01939 [Blumeria graminis f. sp. triticale]